MDLDAFRISLILFHEKLKIQRNIYSMPFLTALIMSHIAWDLSCCYSKQLTMISAVTLKWGAIILREVSMWIQLVKMLNNDFVRISTELWIHVGVGNIFCSFSRSEDSCWDHVIQLEKVKIHVEAISPWHGVPCWSHVMRSAQQN